MNVNSGTMTQTKTKKMTMIAAMCAISYVVMVIGRIPLISAVPFLKYDPKDIIIAIGGFLFGPMSAAAISVIVSIFEMFTASQTGPIGLLMNVLSTCAFACTAAIIYKRRQTLQGAVIGLLSGWGLMVVLMMIWNYLITPLYMGVPREEVVALLIPAILPFNLLKGGLNAALTMLLYKPLVGTLRRARLVAPRDTDFQQQTVSKTMNRGVMLVSAVVLVTCILAVLVFMGIL